LAAQQARLEEERRAFQASQQETLARFADLAAQAANRPSATPQGLAQTDAPQISSDTPDDEENIDALRRGRRGLRIDLQASSGGSAGGGLNVPRG